MKNFTVTLERHLGVISSTLTIIVRANDQDHAAHLAEKQMNDPKWVTYKVVS